MSADVASERGAAMRLVGAGDLTRALVILRQFVAVSNQPEDRLLAGRVAYVATDFDEARVQLERAYRDFQSRGLPRRAAVGAMALAHLHLDGSEEPVVGSGWLLEPCVWSSTRSHV